MLSSSLQTVVQTPQPHVVPVDPAPAIAPLPPGAQGGGGGTGGPNFDIEHLRHLEEQLRHLEGLEGLRAQVPDQMALAGMQPPFMPPHIPEELIGLVLGTLMLLLLMIVGYPIARALARRIDRQSVAAAEPSGEVVSRLERIEHAVETMAVEIERISEGQRFTTRLLTEQTRGARFGMGESER